MSRRAAAMPAAGIHPTSLGTAELIPGDQPGQWTLMVNGAPSSPVDVAHPERLGFEYLSWMDAATSTHFGESQALDAVHLGGAGCALAWAWSVTRRGSTQLAVEIDAELARLVREWFDLPAKPTLRIRVGDAREVLASRRDASADVVVRDVFADGTIPLHVVTTQFTQLVARVLRPGGLYLANVADSPPLLSLRREVATLQACFEQVAVVAESGSLRGRRFANSVCVASQRPIDQPLLHRSAARVGIATTVLAGSRLDRFVAGARAIVDPVPVEPQATVEP